MPKRCVWVNVCSSSSAFMWFIHFRWRWAWAANHPSLLPQPPSCCQSKLSCSASLHSRTEQIIPFITKLLMCCCETQKVWELFSTQHQSAYGPFKWNWKSHTSGFHGGAWGACAEANLRMYYVAFCTMPTQNAIGGLPPQCRGYSISRI